MTSPISPRTFDFESHERLAVERYQKVRSSYEEFAEAVRSILEKVLDTRGIKVASIEARAKSLESFRKKSSEPSADPSKPKYDDPMTDIQDLCGVRVITFFPNTVAEVDKTITEEFLVVERTDKAEPLRREERFGYQSVHYVVRLKENRVALPEYRKFRDMVAEIQVRTILQHAWAEIEHDIEYKSPETIPSPIRRRFMSLAGMLEIADREFQGIQDQDERLKQEARTNVAQGKLESVEITPDALRAYLDKKLGPDRRLTSYSYEFYAGHLLKMGFVNIRQIDECISGYDDDNVSRLIWGTRPGQLARFESLMVAGMGEQWVKRHPVGHEDFLKEWASVALKNLRQGGIKVGDYVPSGEKKMDST